MKTIKTPILACRLDKSWDNKNCKYVNMQIYTNEIKKLHIYKVFKITAIFLVTRQAMVKLLHSDSEPIRFTNKDVLMIIYWI